MFREQDREVLGQILNEVKTIKQELTKMALDISALTTAVANETTVEQSAITLVGGLAAQIQTLINNSGNTVDPVALQALVTQMTNSQTALAAAVAANTVAAPTASAAAKALTTKP
jgi:hypothetical protein